MPLATQEDQLPFEVGIAQSNLSLLFAAFPSVDTMTQRLALSHFFKVLENTEVVCQVRGQYDVSNQVQCSFIVLHSNSSRCIVTHRQANVMAKQMKNMKKPDSLVWRGSQIYYSLRCSKYTSSASGDVAEIKTHRSDFIVWVSQMLECKGQLTRTALANEVPCNSLPWRSPQSCTAQQAQKPCKQQQAT